MRQLIYLILFLFSSPFIAQNSNHGFTNLTVNDGLPSSEVYDVVQDKDGLIWFATDNGVANYDGYKFKTFNTENGLSDDVVFKFFIDTQGRIWCVTLNCRLSYFEDGKAYEYQYNNLIMKYVQNTIINDLHVSEDGTVHLLFIKKGYLKINPDGRATYLFENQNEGVTSIEIDDKIATYSVVNPKASKGEIRGVGDFTGEICLNVKGLNYCEPTTKYNLRGQIEIGGGGYRRLMDLGSTRFLFTVASAGLLFRNNEFQEVISFDNPVTCIKKVGDEIWLGEYKSGIKRLDTTINVEHPIEHLLGEYSVSSMLKDREGGYWFCTLENGVYYSQNIEYVTYNKKNGLKDDYVSSLVGGENGSIYVGLRNGYLQQINSLGKINFTKQVNAVTHLSGLYFDKKKKRVYASGKPFGYIQAGKYKSTDLNIYINQFSRRQLESLWCFNFDYLINIESENTQYFIYEKEKLRYTSVFAVRKDSILVGTTSGLFHFDGKKFHSLREYHPLLSNRIEVIEDIGEGEFAFGTKASGLFISKDDSLYTISKQNGLSSNSISDIRYYNNKLWVATNQGINIVSSWYHKPEIIQINNSHGLISNEVTSIFVDNHFLWVGTVHGLTKITIDEIKSNKKKLQVEIVGASVNGIEREIANEVFPYYQNDFTINFRSISYKQAGKITYEYSLLGLDSGWTKIQGTMVRYRSLPAGSYTFKVRSYNEDNIVGTSKTISFSINPPYWQTWWFKLLVAILILLLIVFFFRIRVLSYNKDVVRKILEAIANKLAREEFITVKSIKDGSMVKLRLSDLLWIEGARDYLNIISRNQKVVVRMTMKEMEKYFSEHKYIIRVHKSYIVNLSLSRGVSTQHIILNNQQIPVGRTYKENVKKYLSRIKKKSVK